MKKTRRQIGPGDRTISAMLDHMAKCADGSSVAEADGLQLSFPGEPETIFVAYRPDNQVSWRTRLKWVEKQSAIFLLNAPVLYGLRNATKRKSSKNALHLSFGLSVSLGPPLHQRYSVTVRQGQTKAVVSRNESKLPANGLEPFEVASLPKWAHPCLPLLAKEVAAVCEEYKGRPEVEATVKAIADNRRLEFTYLENLYRRKSGANDRLYGLSDPDSEGSAPIEVEMRRLQQVVLKRYTVHVRLHMLSLGVFENVG